MDKLCSLAQCDEQIPSNSDSKKEDAVAGFVFIGMSVGIIGLAIIAACCSSYCRIWKEKKAEKERRRAPRQRDLERGVGARNGGSNRTAAPYLMGEIRFDRPRDLTRVASAPDELGPNRGAVAGNGDGQNRTGPNLVGEGRFDFGFSLPVNNVGNEHPSRNRLEAVPSRVPTQQDIEDAYAQRGQWREMNGHANLGRVDGWVDENEIEIPVLQGIPVDPGNRNGVIIGDDGDWERLEDADIHIEENPDRSANDEDETLPPYEEARLPEYGEEDRGGEWEEVPAYMEIIPPNQGREDRELPLDAEIRGPEDREEEAESISEQEPQEPPPIYEEFEELAYSGAGRDSQVQLRSQANLDGH